MIRWSIIYEMGKWKIMLHVIELNCSTHFIEIPLFCCGMNVLIITLFLPVKRQFFPWLAHTAITEIATFLLCCNSQLFDRRSTICIFRIMKVTVIHIKVIEFFYFFYAAIKSAFIFFSKPVFLQLSYVSFQGVRPLAHYCIKIWRPHQLIYTIWP